jgi:citrate lyase beta subunit
LAIDQAIAEKSDEQRLKRLNYFNFLSPEQKQQIFYLPPTEEPLNADKETLSHALGATLYMPGNSTEAITKLINHEIPGLISSVLCLEDAVDDRDILDAERNLAQLLVPLQATTVKGSQPPYVFIRVRSIDQFKRLTQTLGPSLEAITGFVFPKFDAVTGWEYFEHLVEINKWCAKTIYGMPILESPPAIYLESRFEYLIKVKELLDKYKSWVLNVRIGATDLSGVYGLRRGPELTIYDIGVIRDFISLLVNVFGRPQDGYVISGPVWEYFSAGPRVLKPQLRQSPFRERYGSEGKKVRQNLLGRYLDGLIREVMLDKANGIIGKTVIHPSHILPVQSLYTVTHEEYCDAKDVLANGGNGGVTKSVYNNKMNEPKPHVNWAQKVMTLAKIYGVLKEDHDYTSIIYEGDKLSSTG